MGKRMDGVIGEWKSTETEEYISERNKMPSQQWWNLYPAEWNNANNNAWKVDSTQSKSRCWVWRKSTETKTQKPE